MLGCVQFLCLPGQVQEKSSWLCPNSRARAFVAVSASSPLGVYPQQFCRWPQLLLWSPSPGSTRVDVQGLLFRPLRAACAHLPPFPRLAPRANTWRCTPVGPSCLWLRTEIDGVLRRPFAQRVYGPTARHARDKRCPLRGRGWRARGGWGGGTPAEHAPCWPRGETGSPAHTRPTSATVAKPAEPHPLSAPCRRRRHGLT
jgi:hypothetical protein